MFTLADNTHRIASIKILKHIICDFIYIVKLGRNAREEQDKASYDQYDDLLALCDILESLYDRTTTTLGIQDHYFDLEALRLTYHRVNRTGH